VIKRDNSQGKPNSHRSPASSGLLQGNLPTEILVVQRQQALPRAFFSLPNPRDGCWHQPQALCRSYPGSGWSIQPELL